MTGEPRAPHDTAAAATLGSELTGLPPAAEQSPPGPGAEGLRLVCPPPSTIPVVPGPGRGLRGPGRAVPAARRPPLLAGAALRPQPRLRGRPQRPAGHRHPLRTLLSPPRCPLSAPLGTATPSGPWRVVSIPSVPGWVPRSPQESPLSSALLSVHHLRTRLGSSIPSAPR